MAVNLPFIYVCSSNGFIRHTANNFGCQGSSLGLTSPLISPVSPMINHRSSYLCVVWTFYRQIRSTEFISSNDPRCGTSRSSGMCWTRPYLSRLWIPCWPSFRLVSFDLPECPCSVQLPQDRHATRPESHLILALQPLSLGLEVPSVWPSDLPCWLLPRQIYRVSGEREVWLITCLSAWLTSLDGTRLWWWQSRWGTLRVHLISSYSHRASCVGLFWAMTWNVYVQMSSRGMDGISASFCNETSFA